MTLGIGSSKAISGFSLLELILTLALISMLSTLFAFHFFSASSNDVETAKGTLSRFILKTARISNLNATDETVIMGRTKIRRGLEEAQLPDGVSMKIKRNADSGFRPPIEDEVWVFSSNKFIEPVQFELTGANGGLTFTVDPLTAYTTTNKSWAKQ